jgi:hypothetical protein
MKDRYLAVVLPTALYGGLHPLGWVYPVPLWGVDQLGYYGWPVQAGCALLFGALLALGLKDSWLVRVEGTLCSWAVRFGAQSRLRTWLPRAFLVCLPLAFYTFRVRAHALGDSTSWFRAVEALVARGAPPPFTWALEPLDFGVHLSLYWLGKYLVDWSARDVYEAVSCVAGAGYVYLAYRVACLTRQEAGRRVLVLSALLTLGTVQLLFGYGEHYTLATVGAVAYVWLSMRFLLQRSGWHWPALALLLTCACHLMALCLVPSFAYLMWRDERSAGRRLRQWRVAVPLLAAAAAGAVALYLGFYRHHHLPLLNPDAPGRYPILSLQHFGTLANEVLLLSPFGLVWGAMALARRHRMSPVVTFLGWGAIGSGALIAVHNITMGGRDWDLMSFPGLFYTLWGLFGLLDAKDSPELRRAIRMVAMPALAIHTGLWIGINANPQRSVQRLGNLLQYTNQPLHYRQWALGYYHLNIRVDARSAVPCFRVALEQAPADANDPQRLRNRYRKYLGYSLSGIGDHEQAIVILRQAFDLDPVLWGSNDLAEFRCLVKSLVALAGALYEQGEESRADDLWSEAAARCSNGLAQRPDADLAHLEGIALFSLGQYAGAIDAFRQSLSLGKDPATRYATCCYLAVALYGTGDATGAAAALEQAARAKPEKRGEIEQFGRSHWLPPQQQQ